MRINPDEVHIRDSKYFNQLYSMTNKLDKWGWYYRFAGAPNASFGTANADLHRMRRKALSRFFSPSAIANIEESVNRCVQRLCERFREHAGTDVPVVCSNAYRCFAGDVVSQYCLPEGLNLLDSADFAADYNKQARTLSYVGLWNRYFDWIIPLFLKAPRWLVEKTATSGAVQAFDFQSVSTQLPFLYRPVEF